MRKEIPKTSTTWQNFFQDKFEVAKILGVGKSLSMTAMLEEMAGEGERNTGERSGEMSNYGCYCSPHDAFDLDLHNNFSSETFRKFYAFLLSKNFLSLKKVVLIFKTFILY